MMLLAAVASGDTLSLGSYNSWQWNGFSKSAPVGAATSSSLVLSSTASSSSLKSAAVIAPESMSDSPVAASVGAAAILSGVVYYDVDGDGIRESSDWGIRDAVLSLTSASGGPAVLVVTDMKGAYTFNNLTADNYTITLLTVSAMPEAPKLGSLTDANGDPVSSGLGIVLGQVGIGDIRVKSDYTGANYDFPQLAYPTQLISKRMLLNTDPGVHHTNPGPKPGPNPVPEPGTLALLVVAGLVAVGFTRRRRS